MVSRAAGSSLGEVRQDGDRDWDMVGLQKLILYLSANALPFEGVMRDIVARQKDLRLILYCDGVTPGAALTHDNKRKSVIWYASFLEFGLLLCHEECWFTMASARTLWVKQVPAGISGLTRRILRDLFLTQDISGTGVVLAGKKVRVYFHALLADEEALNAMWYIKGASGTVPCAVLCSVVSKPVATDLVAGHRSLTERSPMLVDTTCSDIKRIGCKTDADVWALCDEVAASVGTPLLKWKQQTKGFTYHADALLFDHELRPHVKPASGTRVDAMHIVYSNGVLNAEIMLFLQSLKEKHGFYFQELRDFLQPWAFSKTRNAGAPADCFNERREKSSHEMLKVGASELLAIYPAIRLFVFESLSGSKAMVKEVASLMKLFDVCDLLGEAMRCSTATRALELADQLDIAVAAYLEAFVEAYGIEAMRFKHHQLLHLANQLRKDGWLLTCWTLERKHITSKQCFANYKHAETLEFLKGG
jgi:hypothetical protein